MHLLQAWKNIFTTVAIASLMATKNFSLVSEIQLMKQIKYADAFKHVTDASESTMAKKNVSIHQVILTLSYFDVFHPNRSGYKFSGVVDPVTGKKDIICKNKKENCGAAQCQCDRQLAFQLAEAEITWNPNHQGLNIVI